MIGGETEWKFFFTDTHVSVGVQLLINELIIDQLKRVKGMWCVTMVNLKCIGDRCV